jgi:hypothetical protein
MFSCKFLVMCQGPLTRIDITMSICKVLVICQGTLSSIDNV